MFSKVIAALALAVPLMGVPVGASAATSGTWSTTNSMTTARESAASVVLNDGRVLVAGGDANGPGLTSAEIYDPSTGTWSATGSLNLGRTEFTLTKLNNGLVLAAGGNCSGQPNCPTSSAATVAELYDPNTGVWSNTGTMNFSTFLHTATLLSDGRVLVAGGFDSGALATAEIYNPATGTWLATGGMATQRSEAVSALLPDGSVLVAGGHNDTLGALSSTEIYNPVTGLWAQGRAMSKQRQAATATVLPGGSVLVAGGAANSGVLSSAETYDPFSGRWKSTQAMNSPHVYHSAVLLGNGNVLVVGCTRTSACTLANETATELYDPGKNKWMGTGSSSVPGGNRIAELLLDGTVLLAGGSDFNSNVYATAEIYTP